MTQKFKIVTKDKDFTIKEEVEAKSSQEALLNSQFYDTGAAQFVAPARK